MNYPSKAEDIKGMDVVKKSKLCKAELKEKFSHVGFRKSSKRYAGGASFTIYVEEDVTEQERVEIEAIVNKYQYYYPDHEPQFDYFHVDNYSFTRFSPKRY